MPSKQPESKQPSTNLLLPTIGDTPLRKSINPSLLYATPKKPPIASLFAHGYDAPDRVDKLKQFKQFKQTFIPNDTPQTPTKSHSTGSLSDDLPTPPHIPLNKFKAVAVPPLSPSPILQAVRTKKPFSRPVHNARGTTNRTVSTGKAPAPYDFLAAFTQSDNGPVFSSIGGSTVAQGTFNQTGLSIDDPISIDDVATPAQVSVEDPSLESDGFVLLNNAQAQVDPPPLVEIDDESISSPPVPLISYPTTPDTVPTPSTTDVATTQTPAFADPATSISAPTVLPSSVAPTDASSRPIKTRYPSSSVAPARSSREIQMLLDQVLIAHAQRPQGAALLDKIESRRK